MSKSTVSVTWVGMALFFSSVLAFGDQPATAAAGAALSDHHRQLAGDLIQKGTAFLLSQRQADGGWCLDKNSFKPATTAMALTALLQAGVTDANVIDKGFEVVLSFRQSDGGIYNPAEGQENYTTSVALMALVAAKNPKYQPIIADAVKYLKGLQIVPGSQSPDGQTLGDKDPRVGGVSYGRHGRPDLSNVGMWMDALHDAGVSGDDPAMQRALAFVTNTQNRSETNTQLWAKQGSNDGGFVYAPRMKEDPNGESNSKEADLVAGIRSYGSMTYTGFKSMLYANVDHKDPRVQSAFKWIQTYWRLDANPNMPTSQSLEGLYYYYHVFAKALRAWSEPVITDVKGQGHNWREELIDALAQRIKPEGRWENESPRWFERLPVLSTCYSVLALEETLK